MVKGEEEEHRPCTMSAPRPRPLHHVFCPCARTVASLPTNPGSPVMRQRRVRMRRRRRQAAHLREGRQALQTRVRARAVQRLLIRLSP